MSLPTQQLTPEAKNKRMEDICVRFCSRFERASQRGDVDPSSSQFFYSFFEQCCIGARWENLCNMLLSKSSIDGGELLQRFAKNWFAAARELKVPSCRESVLREVQLIMRAFAANSLDGDALGSLRSLFKEQLMTLEPRELSLLCTGIADFFTQGVSIANGWVGVASLVLRRLPEVDAKEFHFNNATMDGRTYQRAFLEKLSEDIVVSSSLISFALLLRECDARSVLTEHVESCLQKEPDSMLCSKLAVIVADVPIKVAEQICEYLLRKVDMSLEELLPLCELLHSAVTENSNVARVVFGIIKRDKHLVTSRVFPLMCVLVLCNTRRLRAQALAELKQSVVKLWKYGDKLSDSLWIRSAVGECDVEAMKANLEMVMQAVSLEEKWYKVIGSALKDLAFMLLADKVKGNLKVSSGRIESDVGVASMGKRLLVTLAGAQPSSLGTLLDEILNALSLSANHSSMLFLIDVVVEIVTKHTIFVLNAWKSLCPIIDTICTLKEEAGVSLVRALLPVIVQRPQLVAAVVAQMRSHVLCESTVSSALPILLLLLRSSTVRAAVRNDQFTQSFATFSTQALQGMGVNTNSSNNEVALEIIGILKRALSQPAATRVVLYRGIVEAAYANENLVDPAVELLATRFPSLPPISRDAYVEVNKSGVALVESLPDFMQAMSVLIRLSIHGLRNTSTQTVSGRDEQVANTLEHFNKFIDAALEKDIHDLDIDKLSDFTASSAGRANITFSYMLISLYDAFVEHLWHVGSVLTEIESAEKIAGLLRRRAELWEVLEEKLAKKKDGKEGKITGIFKTNLSPQLQTLTSMLNRFIAKDGEDESVNEECIAKLRGCAFDWLMYWVDASADHFPTLAANSSLSAIAAFARANLLLYCGEEFVHESAAVPLWKSRATRAAKGFAAAVSLLVSKYGSKCDSALLELWKCAEKERNNEVEPSASSAGLRLFRSIVCVFLPKVFAAEEDFDERKATGEYTQQALALLRAARSLLPVAPNTVEKFQKCATRWTANLIKNHKFVERGGVLKEVWRLYVDIARRGMCDDGYTGLLRSAAVQIDSSLANKEIEEPLESIQDATLAPSAEMVASACSASIADVNLAVEIISQPAAHANVSVGLANVLEMCSRLSEVILSLLPLTIVHSILKDQTCVLLTSLYSSLNSIVKLLLTTNKSTDVSEWECITSLARLARGPVLRIMESADESIGMHNYEDEPIIKNQRKRSKVQKEETIYVSYVRAREQYQANLLLLSSALDNKQLDVLVRNNSIGARDFRIDAEKLKQKLGEMDDDNDDYEARTRAPAKKKKKAH